MWWVIGRVEKGDPDFKTKVVLKEVNLPLESQYVFGSADPVDILTIYFSSLWSEFDCLTNPDFPDYEKNRKSDYFKISVKGLLLQLIQITHFMGLQELNLKYLKCFTERFANTLTYAHEMRKYWDILIGQKVIVAPEVVENDNKLIEEINYLKIRIRVESKGISEESFMAIYKELSELYRLRVKEIEKNRKLEKGERYISDEFYTLISDYARKYI